MARTRKMSKLLQLVGDVRESEYREVPVERIDEERQSGLTRTERLGISRRDFLKAGGGIVLGTAIFGRPDTAYAAKSKPVPTIGIMGAGIAGMTAAYTLQQAGLGSTVFESSKRIGGRMHTLETSAGYWNDLQYSEWCGEFINPSAKTLISLCKTFGLTLTNTAKAVPKGSQETNYVFGEYYTYEQARSDFKPVAPILSSQLKDAPFPTLYNSYTSEGKRLDNLNVYQWIEDYVPGGISSGFGALLNSIYIEETGRNTTTLSALGLVYAIGNQPTKQPTGGFSWTGTETGTYKIAGGNQKLPIAIFDRVTSHSPACTVHLQWKMTAIAVNSNGRITCEFSTPTGTTEKTFDDVILTMPFSVLRSLDYSGAGFNNLKKTAISQLGYGTNTKMNMQFDTRYWNATGPWPGVSDGTVLSDLPFNCGWDASAGQSGTTGIEVLFNGGSEGASISIPQGPFVTVQESPQAASYVKKYLSQLNEVLPGATSQYNGLATVSTPWSDPNLLGSYSCLLVGQNTLFNGYQKVRQGNIHFAGEACSVTFYGFMEGGAESGVSAAKEIISDYEHG